MGWLAPGRFLSGAMCTRAPRRSTARRGYLTWGLWKTWFELRVYVLLLEGGRMYVGITPRADLKRRFSDHWNGKGSHYTKVYKPQAVLIVWPAAHRGVEALVFQALLSQLHKVSVGDFLGGWVQTSSNLSPLQSMVFEEQRRQVREDCFRCGGGHYASACKRTTSNLFCTYKCKNCDATIDVTSRGEDQKPAGGTAGGSKTSSSDRGGSSKCQNLWS